MSRKVIYSTLILFATFLIAYGFINPAKFSSKSNSSLVFEKQPSWEKEWKKVDSLSNKGLTQSALDLVNKLYTRAKAENIPAQFIKTILFRMKFERYKEEFSLEKSIFELQKEVELTKFPIRPVVQSILAEAYWQYYQNNRWKFLNRSTTVNFKNEDVSTWDLNKIVSESIKNHMASLANEDSLKRTEINLYDQIINQGGSETRTFRPTLFDFLAHRAIDFFKSSEADLNRPASQFHLNDPIYLKEDVDFTRFIIEKPVDTLNLKYYAIAIYQKLEKFHSTDASPEALINTQLLRLNYAFSSSKNELKDSIYLRTLKSLALKFESNKSSAEISFLIAQWYNVKSKNYQPLVGDQWKYYNKIALTLADSIATKYPNSYGALQCKSLSNTILTKNINLQVESINEPSKPFRALISYKNIKKLYFKVVKATYPKKQDNYENLYGEKLIKKLLSLPEANKFEINLPEDQDYNDHSVEIKIPELKEGYYYILASTSPLFSTKNDVVTYMDCTISNLAFLDRRKADGTYDIYVMHRQTGEPLSNVKAQLWFEHYNYTTRKYVRDRGALYTSDANGYFNVPIQNDNRSNFFIEFSLGNDELYSEKSFYTYQPNDYERTTSKTFIFTDRSMYRPGQTIFFKAIRLTTTGEKMSCRLINH